MGLLDKLVGDQSPKNTQNNNIQNASEDQLSPQELEYLLNVLKSTQLVGDQVEMFYILVVKLQNQYLKQSAK
jgi:hypothetical protein